MLFYEMYKNNKNYYIYVPVFICYIVALLNALGIHKKINDNPYIIILYITVFFGLFTAISLKKITNNTFSFLGMHYKRIVTTLGAITYPLYLLHYKIASLTLEIFTSLKISPYVAVLLLIFFLASLVFLLIR
jgi:peptidoglycan/LPS O-acetylase OafA/YrhL